MTRLLVVVSIAALLVSACGASGGDEGSTNTTLLRQPGDLQMDTVNLISAELVDEMGDESAFVAVFLALDRGYTINQVLGVSGSLGFDGIIEGMDPFLAPFASTDLVAAEAGGVGEDATGAEEGAWRGAPSALPVSYRRVDVAQSADQGDPVDPAEVGLLGLELTLGDVHREMYRQQWDEMMGVDPTGRVSQPYEHPEATTEGMQGLAGVMILAGRGYTPEQITLAIMAGDIETDPPLYECLKITGEAPKGDYDRFLWRCPPLPSDNDDPEVGGSSTTTRPPADSLGDGGGGSTPPVQGSEDAYCDLWDGYWASWGGDMGSVSIGGLAEAWVLLTEAAPAEIRADMVQVQAIWDRAVANRTTVSLYDSEGPEANAVASVSIYVEDTCGIYTGLD